MVVMKKPQPSDSLSKRMKAIDRQIARIKEQIVALGDLRPGTLSSHVRQEQGGRLYWHLSYTHQMRSCTDYVRTEHVKAVREEVKAYRRLKQHVERWIELGLEKSRLVRAHEIQTRKEH